MTTFSKRRSIIKLVIDNLKLINANSSAFRSDYTFRTNMFNNVFRGNGNFEDINDYPTIQVVGGPERYIYNTVGNTEAYLTILLRCYLKDGDRTTLRAQCDALIQDVDHVIYNMSTVSHNIHTIRVLGVDSTQSLLDDLCVIEIQLAVKYELDIV